jgi:predicted alpha-1,6-mannanase (GH76 family)
MARLSTSRRWATADLITRLKPRSRVAHITAVALAAVASFAGLSGSDTFDARDPERASMAELFESYNPATGLIGDHWWQAAVALSTVETYAQTTGDTSYDVAIARAFAVNSSGKFENSSNDDTAWWALAWLQAYDLTHVRSYLSMAEAEADFIQRTWDRTCGGGVWWQRSPRAYKNAISNELFLELTAWLHNEIHGDTKYLRWAEAEWSWLDHSGMINDNDLVNDGLDDNCANNAGVTWTYNQGVILAGLAQLYRATGDHSLLSMAKHMARSAIGQLTVGGVLAEPCEVAACADQLDNDTRAFKGIFVRDLKVLAVTAKTSEFNGFFVSQARSIEARDTIGYRQHGMSWAGPVADASSASQASALDALVASIDLPGTAGRTGALR